MKFSLVLLIVGPLVLAGTAANVDAGPLGERSTGSSELDLVLKEFLALVPKDKVIEIAMEYLETDAEVQAVVVYVRSDDFKNLVTRIESIEDVMNFFAYLHEGGLDIYGAVNKLHEAIGLPPLVPGGQGLGKNLKITGGVAGLIADVKAILPIDEIKALYHEKLKSSPAFARLVEHLKTPRFQELIDSLRANEEFQKILKFAKEAGVDVKAIMDLLNAMLGLEFPDTSAHAEVVHPPLITDENRLFAGLKRPLYIYRRVINNF